MKQIKIHHITNFTKFGVAAITLLAIQGTGIHGAHFHFHKKIKKQTFSKNSHFLTTDYGYAKKDVVLEGILYQLEEDENHHLFYQASKIIDKTEVKRVFLPEQINNIGVEKIGPNCFADCVYLHTIFLPRYLHIIDQKAFFNCVSLQEIIFLGDQQKLHDMIIDQNAFVNIKANSKLHFVFKLQNQSSPFSLKIFGENQKVNDFVIINNLLYQLIPYDKKLIYVVSKCLNDYANEIYICDWIDHYPVTQIIANAFIGCCNIHYLSIPATIEKIDENSFDWCNFFTKIKFITTCQKRIILSDENYSNLQIKKHQLNLTTFSNWWGHYWTNNIVENYSSLYLETFKMFKTHPTHDNQFNFISLT